MSIPTVIATVSGPDGFETCYVSFKSVVAADGALVGLPEVESLDPDRLTISEQAISFTGTINGTTYAAGEMLTFKATNNSPASAGNVEVEITYETPARKETVRVRVAQRDFEV